MRKNRIRLSESQLHRVIRESVNKILNEVWDVDDEGIIDYDEFGRAKNRSYADVIGIKRGTPSDVAVSLSKTPYKDKRAQTNIPDYMLEPNKFADDRGKYLRPSDWFVRGADGVKDDEFVDFDRKANNPRANKNQTAADMRWMKSADSRPLYRKNSPNNDIPM